MLFNEIFSRVKLASILIVTACLVSAISKKVKVKHGPSGLSFDDGTNCSQFSKFGRFNPLSVLREKWFVFYYWAPFRSLTTFIFTFPTANHTRNLKRIFDGNVVLPVMWSAPQILMEDNNNFISLLVERGDRGEYWLYPVGKVKGGHKITPRDIRMKQTGDNRLLGLMDCVDQTVLVMARLNDVPRKDKLHEEASRLGYKGRRGKSYLYQGHEWGPIPEGDEELYWDYGVKGKRGSKDTTTENKSSEEISEEVESQPTNKPEYSKEKKSKAGESKAVSPVADLDYEMCVKVEPELWNDPKPDPKPDNLLITKEDLDNLDYILDSNNTLTIEAPDKSPNNKQENKLDKESDIKQEINKIDNLDYILDSNNTVTIEARDGSPNNKQENKLDKESDITQEINKLDNHKDVDVHEMGWLLNVPKNHELQTESPEAEEENCVVCYKSQVSYISTSESYRPESTRSINNLKNNEEVTRTEAPRAEVPLPKVPLAEVPRPEIPRPKIPRAEISRAKVPAGPPAPQQDLTNSSEVIILSPKTLDDLKS